MLWVWVLSLAAGFANACVSSMPTAHAGEHAAHASQGTAAHGLGAGDSGGEPANPGCKDLGNKASGLMSTPKAALDGVLGAALLAPADAGVVPVPALAPVRAWVPRRDGVWAPPIHIAFLRLTL